MSSSRFSSDDYRSFFGYLPTGVTVVLAKGPGDTGDLVGMVVGSFASVSLDPPLVSLMVRTGSRSFEGIRAAGRFTANILASDQGQLSRELAGRSPERFRGVSLDPSAEGIVRLTGCLAWADCVLDHEVPAGDHTIVLATPLELQVARPTARPLVFAQSGYHRTLRVEEARPPGWV